MLCYPYINTQGYLQVLHYSGQDALTLGVGYGVDSLKDVGVYSSFSDEFSIGCSSTSISLIDIDIYSGLPPSSGVNIESTKIKYDTNMIIVKRLES